MKKILLISLVTVLAVSLVGCNNEPDIDVNNPDVNVRKEAYFKLSSTTDYNGVYKGRYIDFEAKETKNATSFPLQNFHEHQIIHMQKVLQHDGICFVIIRFTAHDETYLLDGMKLITYWNRMKDGGRKSISRQEMIEEAFLIRLNYQPKIDYLTIIDELYFK